MELVKMDIDQLLDATQYNQEEDIISNLMVIEIDMLLAVTQDW